MGIRGLNKMTFFRRTALCWFLSLFVLTPHLFAADPEPLASATPLIEATEPQGSAPQTEPDSQEMLNIESDLNSLKEDIFRSKARTVLLQEFLINTEVDIYLNPISQKHFRIKSILLILDNSEIFKKDYPEGQEPKNRLESKLFSGVTTPGRHELSAVIVYAGKKSAGFTDQDYEYQVTGDFSFLAVRGETTVVTLLANDHGTISKDPDKRASEYELDLNIKVESDRLAEHRRRVERRTFSLGVESGLWLETFQFVSDRLNISPQTAGVIPLGVRASWYFLPYLGIEGFYTAAFYQAKTGFNGQRTDMSMNWYGLDLMLRYRFGRYITSPEIALMLGYGHLGLDASQTSAPLVRLSDTYDYMDFGARAKVPVNTVFGVTTEAHFYPWIDLDESPVTSGREGNPKGFQWKGGIYWNFYKDITLDLNYAFMFFDNDFTGRATRTDTTGAVLSLAQTRTYFQGALVGLRYEF